MKQKKTSRLLASVLAIAMGATMTSGLFTAQAQEEIGENTIIHAFKNIDVDSKPMARFWFPDAGAGADADDLISEQIEAMAKGGFGGVEIAMIADETTYTNQQAKEYGWGTENWVNVLKKTLRAANAIEDGFKVDITITSHWPPVINTIDPNETTASTELSYQYTKITQDDLNNGTKDLAMPEQKTTDSRNGYFLTVDRFTDASAIQVESVDADGNLTFDFDSITSLKDSVSVKEGAGYAAGIPDEAKAEEMAGGDKTQKQAILDNIYEAFGDVPTEEIPDGEKFDSQGNRKRMADWQDIYQADLSGLKDQLGALDNDMEIKAGDWVLFGVFERGTGQVLSGGGINTMYGRTYATDYFSTEGIQEVIDYWNEHFLSDPELVSLLKENGSSIFEDSIEASHTGPFWTHNMLNELDEGYAYADEFATVVAVNSAKSSGGGFPGGPGGGGNTTPPIQFNNDVTSRIVEDYNLKLGELYESDHASVISEWAKTFHYNYRAQGYTLTGLDIAGAAAALDIPEGDNATSGDGLRNLSAAVNMYDKQYLSMEAITTVKIASTWETIAGILNSNFSHGVNRVILHGTPYAKTFDNNHTAWPGWGWGGGGAGVGEFTAWNQRQIYWEDVNTIADFMSRNQALLQNGTAKVDVALLNDTSSSFSILSGNCMQGLLDNGYSYNILSEALLKSKNANVTNGVLYEDGPSYKAVILNEANVLSVDTLEKLNQYADAGLPIILYNCSPSQVYGTETADNNDETLVQLVDQLKQHEKVASVSSEEELLTILDQLQVSSAVSYQASGIETSHRTDSTNSDYYYIFNSTEETQTTTMTLEGQGTPYIMDSWTGEITPIAHYTQTEDTITCDVTLEPQESTIIAIAPDQEEFGSSQDVHVEEANGTVVYDGNDIVYRSNTVGTDTVKFSDGTTKEITIDETMAEIDLSGEGWNLQLDSYGPDDSPENLDENGELIDPTAHKITTLNYANIALIPWTSLDVSEDDLKALSTSLNEVTSMRDVSGIGYYTKTFTLPEDWDSSKGAVVTFAHDEDMVTKVTVNDTTIDKIDSINEVVDIGNYLKPGENTIQIKLDTTVKNRISLETGYVDSPWVTESRDTDYGLTSVVLKPYTEVVLSADMPEETADKGILNSVIKYAENAKASGEYDNAIESVQKSFDAALENAQAVAANYSATQEDVDAAWKTLLNEIHKLGFVAGDKTELDQLIAAADEIELDKYVEAGKAEFTEALAAAKAVSEDGDAMQAEKSMRYRIIY
ncbi:glycosyl hydrolase [Massilioclostridium coli]|uniref:glycosyl hydrolase n=1 Tax=Massilioclostridium coli TaxID=1870991 RepID=UPI0022E07033|nr:glycosyl hydrolase [Massilioclostridium coli]